MLKGLKGGLIVSCQPVDGGPMDRPDIVAAMAMAAVAGGAVGLRIEGIANLRAVRPLVAVPIIGIVKTDLPDSPVRITVTVADALALMASRDRRTRYLVVGDGSALEGVVSIGDLVKAQMSQQQATIEALEHYITSPG